MAISLLTILFLPEFTLTVFLFTVRVSRCCQIAAVCGQTSSLWLLRRDTNNFSDADTKDCDKLQEILSPQ